MRKKQLNSNKTVFQSESDARAVSRLKTKFLPDGSYFFEDELKAEGFITAKIVTCESWLLELYFIEEGESFFLSGEKQIHPNSKRFGVFYPPFSITQPCYRQAKGDLCGIAATAPLPAEFKTKPIVFETHFAEKPLSAEQALEILASGRNRQTIETNPNASLLSLKAKRLIDENYLIYPSIARIAAKLGVAHEHLSRQFKRDFRMTPSDYLRQLRLADAPLKLARGEEIINVAHDVGYNDLSRFYKQFRQTTKTSPGVCQTILKPQNAR